MQLNAPTARCKRGKATHSHHLRAPPPGWCRTGRQRSGFAGGQTPARRWGRGHPPRARRSRQARQAAGALPCWPPRCGVLRRPCDAWHHGAASAQKNEPLLEFFLPSSFATHRPHWNPVIGGCLLALPGRYSRGYRGRGYSNRRWTLEQPDSTRSSDGSKAATAGCAPGRSPRYGRLQSGACVHAWFAAPLSRGLVIKGGGLVRSAPTDVVWRRVQGGRALGEGTRNGERGSKGVCVEGGRRA